MDDYDLFALFGLLALLAALASAALDSKPLRSLSLALIEGFSKALAAM